MQYTQISMLPTTHQSERYALYRLGQKSTVIVIGLNPSTADDKQLDPTMRKVLRYVDNMGADGFVMMNLYPLRATKPCNLPPTDEKHLTQPNIDAFTQMLTQITQMGQQVQILLAFGSGISKHDYMVDMLQRMYTAAKPYHAHWLCLATTKYGHPRHPLYLKGDLIPHAFDIEEYLTK